MELTYKQTQLFIFLLSSCDSASLWSIGLSNITAAATGMVTTAAGPF